MDTRFGFLRVCSAWLALLLAGLLPLSCMVESGEELRVFLVELDKFKLDSGYLVLFLEDTAGKREKNLYEGPTPPDRMLRLSAPGYDGGEAVLVLQEYLLPASPGGDTFTADNLLREYRLRVRQGDTAQLLPPLDLPAPTRPIPADSAEDVELDADLRWLLDPMPAPGPKTRISFGPVNPPPPLRSGVTQGDTAFVWGALDPETEYFWQVTSFRGQQSRSGPVWRFRTRPKPPVRLAYPECSGCHLGRPLSLAPEYAGGGRVRYRVEPPLPAGLTLDSLTGVIAGTPLAYPDTAGYTVRAANVSGSVAFSLRPVIGARLIEVAVGEPAGGADRVVATLRSPEDSLVATLWDGGPPPDGRIRAEAAAYDGEEAYVLVQAFRDSILASENRLRIWHTRGIADTVPPPALAEPLLLSPADGAAGLDTSVILAWSPGSELQPPPLAELRFGLANPPPRVDSNLAGPRSLRFRALPDTVYYWQVVNVRAGARAGGPVRSFRTRVLPPSTLGYPDADSVYHVGTSAALWPVYAGGGRVRYSSVPPLPAGFVLDSLDGSIRILPEAEAGPGEYQILAANEAGSVRAPLRFRVDAKLHKLEVHDSLKLGDSLSIHVSDPAGNLRESIWEGPAPKEPLYWSRGHDDGSELHIVSRSFRGGSLLLEHRYRVLGGAMERLPPVVPGAPAGPFPATGALDQDTLLVLSWTQDTLPGPAPLWRLRLGLADPPPVFRDSLREPRAALPVLLPDTLYRWSVTTLRAGEEAPGPLWSFRTRPAPPLTLAYPADSQLHVGMPASLAPAYAGGTRARYRVQPPLPAGLALDSLTGRISGTPLDTAAAATYAVTAANVSGSARAEVRLRVGFRLVRISLPEEARAGDSAVLRLVDPAGGALDTLWDGPVPADLRVGAPTPRYDGVEAGLLALVFRRGVLIREYSYAIRGPLALPEARVLGSLPPPVPVSPAETTLAADTALVLAWRSDTSDPPPLSRVYLGATFPPPLYADSVRGDSLAVASLRTDTRYYWRVESRRAARSALGAVTNFRTRPAAPRDLAYPVADTLVPMDREFAFAPLWSGGNGTFRIEPETLPQGWGFNTATGVLYGTAVDLLPAQEFAVTLANVSGSVTTRIRVGVGYRVLDFLLPDTAMRCDSLRVTLTENWHYMAVLNVLLEGPPPPDGRILREVPEYNGLDARVVMQGYVRGRITWESIRQLDASLRIFEPLPLPEMIPPVLFSPMEGYDSDNPAVSLQWYGAGSVLNPQPVQRVFFGLTNPPPPVADSVTSPYWLIPSTLPDTVYYWRVEAMRGDDTVSTPVASFRSYYPAARTLAYPGADSVYARGVPMRLEPAIATRPGYAYNFKTYRSLPPGVDFDPKTGIISGTPNGPSPALDYRIIYGSEDRPISETTIRFRIADDGDTTVRLVARWEFEDTTSGVVTDSSGRGFHGSHNAVARTDGLRGRALRFDDSTYAAFEARGALQVSGYTLSYWFNPDSLVRVQVLGEFSEPGEAVGVGCALNTSGWGVVVPGAVCCNLRPSDASTWQHGDVRERNNLVTAGGLIRDGQWNHVAYTFNPRTWESAIYVNGRLEASRILGPDFTPRTKGHLYLGQRPMNTPDIVFDAEFRGSMDNVEVFDGALGAAAILEMYQSLAPR